MTTTTHKAPTYQHPSTRGVHYLYLNDGKGRMVGCIATVRRGQKLFIGTSFCSATGGDTFRKSQGRTIAEGRALRRAKEQDRIMEIFTSKAIDQKCDPVQFLTRAQHALCVDLDLLTDSTVDQGRPNAFDVLKAILQSVIEFDSDLDDRDDLGYAEADTDVAAQLVDEVCEYFAALDIPGGLVRACHRKLKDVSVEASKRMEADSMLRDVAALVKAEPLTAWASTENKVTTTFRGDFQGLPFTPPSVLGPVIPPTY